LKPNKRLEGHDQYKLGVSEDGKNFKKNIKQIQNKAADENIEEEYIYGLQDEIKLLEYELKLLKDKDLEQQASLSQLDKFFNDGVPLNENILAMKNQYNIIKHEAEGKSIVNLLSLWYFSKMIEIWRGREESNKSQWRIEGRFGEIGRIFWFVFERNQGKRKKIQNWLGWVVFRVKLELISFLLFKVWGKIISKSNTLQGNLIKSLKPCKWKTENSKMKSWLQHFFKNFYIYIYIKIKTFSRASEKEEVLSTHRDETRNQSMLRVKEDILEKEKKITSLTKELVLKN